MSMKKNGFTLVEMLAVVVIMGLLIIVAIPQIQNLVASKRDTIKETTLQMIYDAADSYTESDTSTFQKMYINDKEYAAYCIKVKNLIEAGKIDEESLKDYIDYDADKKEGDEGYVPLLERTVYVKTNRYNEFEYELLNTGDCNDNAFNNDKPKEDYKENGVTAPILREGMIPVVYNESIGSWVKADVKSTWYKYGEKRWANMVTVSSKPSDCASRGNCIDSNGKHTRSYYERSVPGIRISLDDVTGMFVWVPGGNMWVGKFEASAPINTSCFQIPSIDACNKNYIDLVVVPGRNSWKGISFQNAKKVVQNMATSTNFGLEDAKVNSHLMTSAEWNTIKVLTSSSQGRGNLSIFNNNYGVNAEDKKSVITLTGCSSGSTSGSVSTTCSYAYNTKQATSGTTTGNITGIYDLSGGGSEFVENNYAMQICGGNYTSGATGGLNKCDNHNGEANNNIGFRPVITFP